MHRPNLMTVALPMPEIIAIEYLGGVVNPQSWEGEAVGGRVGIVLLERALVTSYRPSIVTFSLSLRGSELLPLFVLQQVTFPHPPL